MARFSEINRGAAIVQGIRARRTVKLPLPGGTTIDVAVRPLTGGEMGRAQAEARAYALDEMTRAGGGDRPIPEPKEGDRLFDLGFMVAVLAIACSDPDHPEVAFFENREEILRELDADRIVRLYEEQQTWQDHCAPSPMGKTSDQFMAMIVSLAAEPEDAPESPFDRWPPSTRRAWARTTSKLCLSLLTLSSPSSSAGTSEASAS
jgi:hypothetical protein